jgi:hypothetical protein
MNEKIEQVLKIWHEHFSDEDKQYSEFESSDIEYFVGCMLYNHFAFSKALDTMKTMDLSYDFLSSCENEYDEVKDIISSIELDNEADKLELLSAFIKESKLKYSKDELYLLNRLEYHVNAVAQRYEKNVEVQKVDFKNLLTR